MVDSTECGKILIWPNDNFSLICKCCGDDFRLLEDFRVHYITTHFPKPPLFIKCEDAVRYDNDCESFPLDEDIKYDLADSVYFSETPANVKNEGSISCGSDCESLRTEMHDENSSLSGPDETIESEQRKEISDDLSELPKSRKRVLECRFCSQYILYNVYHVKVYIFIISF